MAFRVLRPLYFLIPSVLLLCAVLGDAVPNAPPAELGIPDGVSVVVTRDVDLTSQLVKVKVEYEIKNRGKSDVNHFIHTITAEEAASLSWISAYEGKKDAAKLRVTKVAVKDANGFEFFKVELLNLLAPSASSSLTVDYVLTGHLTPHPEEIAQSESQLVLFGGLANVASAYKVEKETSNFKIGSTKPLSSTEVDPSKFSGDKLTYGPYEDVKPFTQKPISIHYENNSPFLVATTVERLIEVSHWGNIAVEEHIEVVHKGAKLKVVMLDWKSVTEGGGEAAADLTECLQGPFSRLDFQMDRRSASKQPVVKNFKTLVPASSQDIYYRDEIGNISTSTVNTRGGRLEVDLRPRFPLFGGWKTNYVLGYNVPTGNFLSSSGSDYALKMRLLDHLFDNAIVEKLRVKIILPETSKNLKIVTPFPVKRLPDEKLKTYLDISGRPVIVLEKENLVNNHNQAFTLYYEFSHINLLRELLIAIAAFFVLFVAVVVLFRMDFSISNRAGKESHAKKE